MVDAPPPFPDHSNSHKPGAPGRNCSILKAGEEAVFDLGIPNMHPELIHHVGRLKYRTSYSQNILSHSIEVAFICGMLASEIGFDSKLARRAGLMHDIGKSVDHEIEGSHIDIGTDLVTKYGEPAEIIDACAKGHDPQPQGVLPLLVQAADAISAARPGARRVTYEAYLKRIQDFEDIARTFHGRSVLVKRASPGQAVRSHE